MEKRKAGVSFVLSGEHVQRAEGKGERIPKLPEIDLDEQLAQDSLAPLERILGDGRLSLEKNFTVPAILPPDAKKQRAEGVLFHSDPNVHPIANDYYISFCGRMLHHPERYGILFLDGFFSVRAEKAATREALAEVCIAHSRGHLTESHLPLFDSNHQLPLPFKSIAIVINAPISQTSGHWTLLVVNLEDALRPGPDGGHSVLEVTHYDSLGGLNLERATALVNNLHRLNFFVRDHTYVPVKIIEPEGYGSKQNDSKTCASWAFSVLRVLERTSVSRCYASNFLRKLVKGCNTATVMREYSRAFDRYWALKTHFLKYLTWSTKEYTPEFKEASANVHWAGEVWNTSLRVIGREAYNTLTAHMNRNIRGGDSVLEQLATMPTPISAEPRRRRCAVTEENARLFLGQQKGPTELPLSADIIRLYIRMDIMVENAERTLVGFNLDELVINKRARIASLREAHKNGDTVASFYVVWVLTDTLASTTKSIVLFMQHVPVLNGASDGKLEVREDGPIYVYSHENLSPESAIVNQVTLGKMSLSEHASINAHAKLGGKILCIGTASQDWDNLTLMLRLLCLACFDPAQMPLTQGGITELFGPHRAKLARITQKETLSRVVCCLASYLASDEQIYHSHLLPAKDTEPPHGTKAEKSEDTPFHPCMRLPENVINEIEGDEFLAYMPQCSTWQAAYESYTLPAMLEYCKGSEMLYCTDPKSWTPESWAILLAMTPHAAYHSEVEELYGWRDPTAHALAAKSSTGMTVQGRHSKLILFPVVVGEHFFLSPPRVAWILTNLYPSAGTFYNYLSMGPQEVYRRLSAAQISLRICQHKTGCGWLYAVLGGVSEANKKRMAERIKSVPLTCASYISSSPAPLEKKIAALLSKRTWNYPELVALALLLLIECVCFTSGGLWVTHGK
jgi:hypothetical protein